MRGLDGQVEPQTGSLAGSLPKVCDIIDRSLDAEVAAFDMDQHSFRKLLRRTVALPVLLVILLAAIIAAEILWLSAALRWVDHADQVIATARQLQWQIVELNTDLHGYQLTGDKVFRDSYQIVRIRVPEQLELIQRLTINPEQQQRLRELSRLSQSWIEWANQQMSGWIENPATSAELLGSQRSLQEIRQKEQDFLAAEEILRRQHARRAAILNVTVIGSALGLSLLAAGLLFTLTRRELMALSSSYERHLKAETEQRQQLKESREQLQITLNSLGEGVVSTDGAGNISFINPVAQRLTGWPDPMANGRPFREVMRLSDERTRTEIDDPIAAVRQAQKVVGFSNSLVLTSRTGEQYPIELTGAPILNDRNQVMGVVVAFRDVTRRRQTEQTLRASERLASAGRLSATIAHEIRNPLDTVANLIYLLQREHQPNDAHVHYLQMASDELARIAQITSQLLTFHREARSPTEVSLKEVLESVLVLFAPQLKQSHVAVECRLETDRTVRGFPGELRQVFSNLVGNAIEAMSGGGRLVLHARQSSLASDPASKGIRVTVLDNGPGIPPGVRKNLFTAFYTTKGEKGTGLGLWISRGILEKHEGTIHVNSSIRAGRSGTAFSVFLPFEQKLGGLDVKPAPPVL
jgi:PAS domain S-box-containing protein